MRIAVRRTVGVVVLVVGSGCAVGSLGAGGENVPDAGVDAGVDAAVPVNAGAPDGASDAGQDVLADVGGPDVTSGSITDAMAPPDAAPLPLEDAGATDAGYVGLDPQLALPSPAGKPCSAAGNVAECPYGQICRIASPLGGRCEGCTKCRTLGSPCAASADCGVLYQCYAGKCTNICIRGTRWCGLRSTCLDIGNASYGVCR